MIALLGAGALSALLTPAVARLAVALGILDHPSPTGGRKSHGRATPYLGGLAIAAAALLGTVLVLATDGREVPLDVLAAGLGLATSMAVLGLVDDLRPLPWWVRLGAQIAAASVAWAAGFQILAAPWQPVNVLLTVFWIVGITNAFNLLDNMDGLSAGLAGLGSLAFAGMALLEGLDPLTVVAAALAGATFGFLVHNNHPARVFMGDSGSLFIGFLISLLAIELRFDNLLRVTFLVPVVVLGLPIFDTALIVLGRIKHGRSPLEGGRDHVSHRLIQIGLPVRATVGLLYWTGACLGWLGLVISRANVQVGWMLLGFVIALGLFFGRVLWRVPVYDESDLVKVEKDLSPATEP